MSTTTYTAYDFANGFVIESGVSEIDAIRAIWESDGKTYTVEPRMETYFDDADEEKKRQETFGANAELVWNVFEVSPGGHERQIHTLRAYGKTEQEALNDLFQAALDRNGYDDRRYSIMTDAEYAADQAKAARQAAQDEE